MSCPSHVNAPPQAPAGEPEHRRFSLIAQLFTTCAVQGESDDLAPKMIEFFSSGGKEEPLETSGQRNASLLVSRIVLESQTKPICYHGSLVD